MAVAQAAPEGVKEERRCVRGCAGQLYDITDTSNNSNNTSTGIIAIIDNNNNNSSCNNIFLPLRLSGCPVVRLCVRDSWKFSRYIELI